MSTLAPLLEAFFTDRLLQQRHASPHTISAYRDAFRLLLTFAHQTLGKAPAALDLRELDAPFIARFLSHLEAKRGNGAATRNARLAAVHSFFRYVALREPAHAAVIQRVLALPHKRAEKTLVAFLTRPEVEALLAAPDQATVIGRRDHALLLLAIQTGLRVSELTQLRVEDVRLDRRGAHVRCRGKGRKERVTPLIVQTARVLRAWLKERAPSPTEPLFASRRGDVMSRDAIERVTEKHRRSAATTCRSLKAKRVSPHVLRHTSAMMLLQADVDRSVIALWLGHESIKTTEIYLHADLSIKERAIARTAPLRVGRKRYRPADRLLAFLEAL